ncbi:MAG: hypothetical protein MI923_20830 [Phycisphaerales bacterium]|nr:hypothetical protein [Phycisphaerales bacterium]
MTKSNCMPPSAHPGRAFARAGISPPKNTEIPDLRSRWSLVRDERR